MLFCWFDEMKSLYFSLPSSQRIFCEKNWAKFFTISQQKSSFYFRSTSEMHSSCYSRDFYFALLHTHTHSHKTDIKFINIIIVLCMRRNLFQSLTNYLQWYAFSCTWPYREIRTDYRDKYSEIVLIENILLFLSLQCFALLIYL